MNFLGMTLKIIRPEGQYRPYSAKDHLGERLLNSIECVLSYH